MKTISFSIPCFNEENNIKILIEQIFKIFSSKLSEYNFYIEFIDNRSTDKTRIILEEMCKKYPEHIRAIFNLRNYGGVSSYYGLLQTDGDCTIVLPCDFQIPLEIIPELIRKWESGSKIVCAVKESSKENNIMWKVRTFYYKLINTFSKLEMVSHFTGAGLYDSEVIKWLKNLNDPIPSLRGMVVEYGYGIEKVTYIEQRRKYGKSKQKFFDLFNVAVKNLINYTKFIPRITSFLGIILTISSILITIFYLLFKLVYLGEFSFGIALIFLGLLFIGGLQLVCLGFLGEYLMIINERLLNRPLVVEEKRLNYKENIKNEVCKN